MAVQVGKQYVLGEFSLEASTRQLSREQRPVRLANKPFQVLLYLIEHCDRLVTRHELLERFWEGREVYDATLTQCVAAIRKALDDRSEPPRFIQTRWAEGYRYIGPFEEQSSETKLSLVEIEQTRGVKILVEEEIHDVTPVAAPALPARRLSGLKSSPRALALVVGLAIVALAGVGLVAYRWGAASAGKRPTPPRSIAVLPLKNLTGDPAQEYFSDGLTESLISVFSQIKDLKVISRTSAFTFKGREVDPREVGKSLGVEGLLEGDFKLDGRTARVEVRLVSTSDGRVLWNSQTFERPLTNLFEIQDTVACAIGSELKVRFCGEGELTKSRTKNQEAYEAYLQGRARWHTRNIELLKEAIGYFERAIKLDPNYALAYAGLADTYAVMQVNHILPPKVGTPKAKAYAAQALALDDSLAGPYATLGLVTGNAEWHWPESEPYFEQALARNPGYATAHHWYGSNLLAQGKWAEAEREFKRALELDPLSFGVSNTVVEFYYHAKNYEACLKQAEMSRKLDPQDENGPFYRGLVYLETGKPERAIEEFKRTYPEAKEMAIAWAQGRRAEALRSIGKFQASEMGRNSPTTVAEWYARLGDQESAFVWLEKAFAVHDSELAFMKVDSAFAGLRLDPRYRDLLRRVGLPE